MTGTFWKDDDASTGHRSLSPKTICIPKSGPASQGGGLLRVGLLRVQGEAIQHGGACHPAPGHPPAHSPCCRALSEMSYLRTALSSCRLPVSLGTSAPRPPCSACRAHSRALGRYLLKDGLTGEQMWVPCLVKCIHGSPRCAPPSTHGCSVRRRSLLASHTSGGRAEGGPCPMPCLWVSTSSGGSLPPSSPHPEVPDWASDWPEDAGATGERSQRERELGKRGRRGAGVTTSPCTLVPTHMSCKR